MSKRANGEGTIHLRADGRWECRITTGRDPGTGKAIRRSVYGKTQAEVRKKLTASAHELDEGVYIPPDRITVGQWLTLWHAEYLGKVKESTAYKYGATLRTHLIPAFDKLRLQQLTAPMVQQLYNGKLRGGLSAKSVKDMHGILHKALAQAVRLGYLRFNPCDACELPRVERRKITPMEGDSIGAFLTAIQGHKYEALYLVTLFTGMRQGEVLGLTWDCVDFQNGVLLIDKQLQKQKRVGGGGPYRLVEVKNDRKRLIAPAAQVMNTLRQIRHSQQQNRLLLGPDWQGDMNLVFTHENGRHLTAGTTYACFKRIVKRLGMGRERFHDLRHTYATLSLQNGDDIKTVSETLGHATVAFTLDVYGHVSHQMRRASADRMTAFIDSVK